MIDSDKDAAPIDFQTGQYDDFSQNLIDCYDLSELQVPSASKDKIKRFHDDNKVSNARFFAAMWQPEHFTERLDLEDRMREITEFIKKADGMTEQGLSPLFTFKRLWSSSVFK